MPIRFLTLPVLLALAAIPCIASGADEPSTQLEGRFAGTIHPFLRSYCVGCHGQDEPEAELDLSTYSSMAAVVKDRRHMGLVLQRLRSGEMPPPEAKMQPSPEARRQAVDWFQAVRDREIRRNAGDPGIVLARRLSNAEFNYTIRDLTGVDIRPTREFPVNPANTAGFDNSGESLAMSPALLDKYLKAAHEVASHMFLKPRGFAFAPHPMLVETDRDKYCVRQIIDFYHRQNADYADYFRAAWRFKHRAAFGKPRATLAEFAADAKVSPKYLETIWSTLEGTKAEVGSLVKLQSMWRELPAPDGGRADTARDGCERMREYVIQLRKKVEPRFLNLVAGRVGVSAQPFLIWKNRQYATHRMTFDSAQLQVAGEPPPVRSNVPEPGVKDEFGPGRTRLIENIPGDPDLTVPAGQHHRYEAAFAAFCRVFPDRFTMEERGRNYFDTSKDRGRYLNAGYHSLMGYFRDDQPLYELLLDDKQQAELDEMWQELEFVASSNIRMYTQFSSNGSRQEGGPGEGDGPAAGSMVEDVTSEARIHRRKARYLARASGGDAVAIQAIKDYFDWINDRVRWVEKARIDAEPSHLDALLDFAARAYRRPLSRELKDDLLGYYRSCRQKDGLSHEAAIRESIVSVLISPDLCYRIDLLGADEGIHRLSDHDLASRLSYFLWSSMPDAELLAHAASGDLHEPGVIAAQARRMLKDGRIRALAVEFGGNWLDFRRFEELSTVDRGRFATFTNELRSAMYEEPIRLLVDVFRADRPVLDLLYAHDTFVNPVLARHYGMPVPGRRPDEWVRIEDARRFQRGGLLPMAVFLTKNAPGLRTSPVKRGNWVVKNVLGERIPPPPPTVPELPRDEARLDLPLRDLLARHRSEASCAACHARFDSLGLVFEGFGPIGERRERDLAGRPVDASATFPGGSQGDGLEGLRRYIRERRQDDFVDNLCGKLLAYALGRSLIPSDDLLIQEMRRRLADNGYGFSHLIEAIVTSRQFLNRRGRTEPAER